MHLWEHFPGAGDEHFLVRAFFLRKISLLTRDSPAHKISVAGRGAAQSKAKHHEFRLSRNVNAGAKVHQWAGMKRHQFQGLWESWFDFWQGGARGGFPPRYCSEYLMSSRSERSSLIRILAAVDRHRRGAGCV